VTNNSPKVDVPGPANAFITELTPRMIGVFYRKHDFNELMTIILNAMIHISREHFYGVYVLNEVLHGGKSEKIIKGKLNYVPEYGKLDWMAVNETTSMISWLIVNHYIHQTTGKYPVLHPTADTAKYNDTITKQKLLKFKENLVKTYKVEEQKGFVL
jgi:superfamily II DNA helicase RecQ